MFAAAPGPHARAAGARRAQLASGVRAAKVPHAGPRRALRPPRRRRVRRPQQAALRARDAPPPAGADKVVSSSNNEGNCGFNFSITEPKIELIILSS